MICERLPSITRQTGDEEVRAQQFLPTVPRLSNGQTGQRVENSRFKPIGEWETRGSDQSASGIPTTQIEKNGCE